MDEAFDQVIKEPAEIVEGPRKLRDQWLRAKARCKPLGSTPVSEVTPRDILDLITPMWHEKTQTARDLRSKLSIVMEWSITEGSPNSNSNPARPGVTGSLGKQEPVAHHKSLPPSELGSTLARIRDSDAWWAIEILPHLYIAFTGVRNGEARRATWDEIDLDTSTWTIPGSRMKAKKLAQGPTLNPSEGDPRVCPGALGWQPKLPYSRRNAGGRPMDSKRLSEVPCAA